MKTRFRQIPKFTGALRFIVGNMTKRELRRSLCECERITAGSADQISLDLGPVLSRMCRMELRRRDRRFKSPPLFLA